MAYLPPLLNKYKGNKRIFIETGTWQGDGILNALGAGFEMIYTCDIDEILVEKSRSAWINFKNIQVLHKTSYEALEEIMKALKEESLIYLDAHVMPLDEHDESKGFDKRQFELNGSSLECPLVKEIQEISKSSIKTHTIIIDDFHCFGNWMFDGLEFNTIVDMVMKINPNYNVSVEGNAACFYI